MYKIFIPNEVIYNDYFNILRTKFKYPIFLTGISSNIKCNVLHINSTETKKELFLKEAKEIISKSQKFCPFDILHHEIGNNYSTKITELPNQRFVKVTTKCFFCGKETKYIIPVMQAKTDPSFSFLPNSKTSEVVCMKCQENNQLSIGSYGYSGTQKQYVTPMDKKTTIILGLEQEFEGFFSGWKEINKYIHSYFSYGYDGSINVNTENNLYAANQCNNGKNEISWCCGSYSWWKYLSPLREVNSIIENNGGNTGKSAGMHIHASIKDSSKDISSVAYQCLYTTTKSEQLKNLWLIVSGRSQEAINKWASLTVVYETGKPVEVTDHHCGISLSRHRTIEFRFFSSCLNSKIILRRMKLVKEYLELVLEGKPADKIINSFTDSTKLFIKQEQEKQIKNQNIRIEQCVL